MQIKPSMRDVQEYDALRTSEKEESTGRESKRLAGRKEKRNEKEGGRA